MAATTQQTQDPSAALVTVGDHGAVRVLTMDRPQARNAMNTALLGALLDAVSEAVAAPDVRAVVFAGAGGAFSAGADLREPLDHDGQVRRHELLGQVYEAVGTCPTPTVAAVAGPAVGGGAELATACDIRVADPTARFRFPGAALGFPVGPARLIGLVGLGAVKDLVLTSRTVAVDEAQRIGLVQRVVAEGTAVDEAVSVGRAIAGNQREAVAFLKRQLDRFSGLGDRTAAENDALHALAEAGGDYDALYRRPGVGGWAGGGWAQR